MPIEERRLTAPSGRLFYRKSQVAYASLWLSRPVFSGRDVARDHCAFAAPCTGPGAPTTTQTKCLTAVLIPRQSAAVVRHQLGQSGSRGILSRRSLELGHRHHRHPDPQVRSGPSAASSASCSTEPAPSTTIIPGRMASRPTAAGSTRATATARSRCSTSMRRRRTPSKQTISTGGTTRLDEMALTTDGKLLLAANNAEDPPFATLFAANGDDEHDHTQDHHQDHGRPGDHARRASACRSSSRRGIRRPSASTRRSRSSPTTRRAAITVSCRPDHLRRRPAGDRSDHALTHGQRGRRAHSIRPPTPASSRSTPADRTAPRSDRMTTSCSAARRRTTRAT